MVLAVLAGARAAPKGTTRCGMEHDPYHGSVQDITNWDLTCPPRAPAGWMNGPERCGSAARRHDRGGAIIQGTHRKVLSG